MKLYMKSHFKDKISSYERICFWNNVLKSSILALKLNWKLYTRFKDSLLRQQKMADEPHKIAFHSVIRGVYT